MYGKGHRVAVNAYGPGTARSYYYPPRYPYYGPPPPYSVPYPAPAGYYPPPPPAALRLPTTPAAGLRTAAVRTALTRGAFLARGERLERLFEVRQQIRRIFETDVQA